MSFRFFRKDTDKIIPKAKSKYFSYPFTSDNIKSIEFKVSKPNHTFNESGFVAKIWFNADDTSSWQTIKADSFFELLESVDNFLADMDEDAKEAGRELRERQLEI